MNKTTVLSFLLATVIVAGAVWVADRSLTTPAAVDAVPAVAPSPRAASALSPVAIPAPAGAGVAEDARARSSEISKCIINGKTVYSDTDCPAGASAEKIALHETAGIVSPPKESLADLTAKRHARERSEEIIGQRLAAAKDGQPAKADECQWLARRIETLDAMARQPQSGQMQDDIKDQRRGARDRQYALRC